LLVAEGQVEQQIYLLEVLVVGVELVAVAAVLVKTVWRAAKAVMVQYLFGLGKEKNRIKQYAFW
jgi:hypothetical protein